MALKCSVPPRTNSASGVVRPENSLTGFSRDAGRWMPRRLDVAAAVDFEQDDRRRVVQRHDDGDEDRCGRGAGRAEDALRHGDAKEDEVRAVDGLDDDALFVLRFHDAGHREAEKDPEEHEAPDTEGDESPTDMEDGVHVVQVPEHEEREKAFEHDGVQFVQERLVYEADASREVAEPEVDHEGHDRVDGDQKGTEHSGLLSGILCQWFSCLPHYTVLGYNKAKHK